MQTKKGMIEYTKLGIGDLPAVFLPGTTYMQCVKKIVRLLICC